jgi:type I restriction enzyme S subunit
MHKNENRPSYKKTKVGWIPEGWEESSLGDFTKWGSGGTPSKANDSFWNGDIPWISAISMHTTRFSDSELKITKEGLKAGSRLAPQNSLLLLVRGSMLFKKIPVGIAERDVAFNQDVKSIIPDTKAVSSEYLLCWLLGHEQRLLGMVGGTGIGAGKLDLQELQSMELALPPLPEQEAIAKVLECWDRGIRNLELKIAKKRLIKKGLMQQLLSGQTRLPGFSKEWKIVNFLEAFEIQKGTKALQVQTSEYQESGRYPIVDQGQKKIVAYTDIDTLYSNVPVVVFGDHTRIVKWIDFPFVIGADGTQLIIAKKIADLNFGYFLISNTELTALGYSRHLKLLKESDFRLPPLEEQRAIAEVLSAADGEIEALEKKLALWKDQKKFLLNNLVTGTVRLPAFAGK